MNTEQLVALEDYKLVTLTTEDQLDIYGGESGWYWLAYGIGWLNHAASPGPSEYDRIRSETGFGK